MWANVPDLELITYPPYPDTTGQDYFTCPQKTNPANWFAHIYLERGNLTDDLSGFGMNIEALDAYDHWYDAIAPPLPPDGNYIRAVFYHPEWGRPAGSAFCRDVRKAFNEASNIPMFKEWTFIVESSDTGQINLNFPEIEKILPEGYSATLFFPDLFLNLLEQHSFSLAYSEPLEIRLRVYNRPATLLGWNLSGIEIQIPDNYGIENIYPNPFNSQALLRVALPQTSLLEVKVYDILGRQTAVLFDGVCPAGYKSVVFEGRNLASGLYFIKMEVPGKFVQMKKVVLIK
jgi:hypothetical protein